MSKSLQFNNLLKREFSGKNIVLLQGPVGTFFARLATKLKKMGAKILKINYNGGDFFFYPKGHIYRGSKDNLAAFYEDFFTKNRTEIVLMYNDCRFINRTGLEVAKRLGIAVWIFEEGYLRPYCITLEKDGVNANSTMPRDKNFYLNLTLDDVSAEIKTIPGGFKFMAFYSFLYWFFAFILAPFFNNSLHHRPLNPLEMFAWFKTLFLKYKYKISEKRLNAKIYKLEKKYFLAILQVYNDTQILNHYKKDIEHFIEETILSFANHARAKSYLVFKHHPMDRGYKNYASLIEKLSEKYHVEGRILYVHDSYLPLLLKNALGCITINSTVGLSAIIEGCPTKVCGEAFYDFDGLTYPKKLHFFWREAHAYKPNSLLVLQFKKYLLQTNQINGNFYKNFSLIK